MKYEPSNTHSLAFVIDGRAQYLCTLACVPVKHIHRIELITTTDQNDMRFVGSGSKLQNETHITYFYATCFDK